MGEESQWENLKTNVKIKTETDLKSQDATRKEIRYYIGSKDMTAEECLKISRNHWAIENNLHWSLDVIFKEDKSKKRVNNVAENFSIMLKVILKLLKDKQQTLPKRISIKRMRKRAAMDSEILNEMLRF